MGSGLSFSARPNAKSSIVYGNWTDWTNSTNTPGARQASTLAYDPLLNAVVMFGGQDTYGNPLGDTWEFVDGNWTDVSSSVGTEPSARWGAGLVWDPQLDSLLLFGGQTNFISICSTCALNDTWTFNASGWNQLNLVVAPSPRDAANALVYDSSDGYVWLSNAGVGSSTLEEWEFTNGAWKDVSSKTKGTLPMGGFFAYDDPGDSIVLYFAGTDSGGTSHGLTWAYHGGKFWNMSKNQTTRPSALEGTDVGVFDPNQGGVVIFSGYTSAYGSVTQETWLFKGLKWTQITSYVGTAPPGRWAAEFAYDSQMGADVTFSGNENSVGGSNSFGTDTWLFISGVELNATAAPIVGGAPLKTTFNSTAERGQGPFRYNWSFGDGSTNATTENATHSYTTGGTFLASLEIDDARSLSGSTEFLITVVGPLVGNSSSAPAGGDAPLAVNFTSHVAGGYAPYSLKWSFGDGSSSALAKVTHTYRAKGDYNWSLNVTDSAHDYLNSSGSVSVFGPLNLSVTPSTMVGVAPLTVPFNASASAGESPYTYGWAFGDGLPGSSSASVSHTYRTVGNYTAVATVTDVGGDRVTRAVSVDVVSPLELSASASPTSGYGPLAVLFSSVVAGGLGPFSYNWSFGPGVPASTDPSPSVTFTTAGTFNVSLLVEDQSHQSARHNLTVVVAAHPALTLSASAPRGLAPFNVTLTAGPVGGVPPLSFRWSFGNSTVVSAPASIEHTFARAGGYLVVVTMVDALSTQVSKSLDVVVGAPLTAAVTANVSSANVGAGITLQATATGGFSPYTYEWSGLPPGCAAGNQSTIECQPTGSGNFSVSVTVVDALGDRVSSSVFPLRVLAPAPQLSSPSNGAGGFVLYLGVIAALAAVAVIAAILLLRRRPPTSPASETGDWVEPPPPTGE
ncbi:MAG: PKD domain-containing protein [Thermoplasmata archaeon]|nr:PKD domain-containing protein [Thermoplasmata archaeon]